MRPLPARTPWDPRRRAEIYARTSGLSKNRMLRDAYDQATFGRTIRKEKPFMSPEWPPCSLVPWGHPGSRGDSGAVQPQLMIFDTKASNFLSWMTSDSHHRHRTRVPSASQRPHRTRILLTGMRFCPPQKNLR